MTSKPEYFRPIELARLAGVSTDTLRHYERKGLLSRPRRSANGYRQYSVSDLDRVHLVRGALEVGFTLNELAHVLKLRDGGGAPCNEVRELASAKLDEVENQLIELTKLRNELRGILAEWDARLTKNSSSKRAGLLETLATKAHRRVKRPLRLKPNTRADELAKSHEGRRDSGEQR